jgi:dolichol-phosphate mannosyltransferase
MKCLGRREVRPLVSIVIPALNEEDNIGPLESELADSLHSLEYDFEFIVIDNGSTDGTESAVRALCARDRRWKYIRFSRNFGVESSITAGYRIAAGDAIVVLYSDLQDPPQLIPEFLKKWSEGYDVVYGVRTVRPGDPRWRNAFAHVGYRIVAALSEVDIPRNAGDFRLISRQVRDALVACGEYNRYLRGLISWLGFRQIGVEYERRARIAGESKAPLTHILVFALNAVTSFSVKPLRLFTLLGFVLVALSLLAIPIYILLSIVGSPPPGITTLIVLALFGFGVNILGIGVLGEYLGRTYAEAKQRPLYVVADAVNVDDFNLHDIRGVREEAVVTTIPRSRARLVNPVDVNESDPLAAAATKVESGEVPSEARKPNA